MQAIVIKQTMTYPYQYHSSDVFFSFIPNWSRDRRKKIYIGVTFGSHTEYFIRNTNMYGAALLYMDVYADK